jgi:hypothetical protein
MLSLSIKPELSVGSLFSQVKTLYVWLDKKNYMIVGGSSTI